MPPDPPALLATASALKQHLRGRLNISGGTKLGHTYKILYITRVANIKQVVFRGSSLNDLRAFPVGARRAAGYQREKVQRASGISSSPGSDIEIWSRSWDNER